MTRSAMPAHAPVRGIIHRYADRVLLNVLSNCAVYCRYCFRRETVGAGSKALSDDELDAAIGYIAGNRAIWKVILSGGDPLMLPAARLAAIAGRIAKIGHVGVLRVHSRVPLAAPERITDAVIAALKIVQPTWLVLHVNHADELTGEVRSTLARLADAGIPLLSQSVLLRGINDDAATLTRLYRELVMLRVKPMTCTMRIRRAARRTFARRLKRGRRLSLRCAAMFQASASDICTRYSRRARQGADWAGVYLAVWRRARGGRYSRRETSLPGQTSITRDARAGRSARLHHVGAVPTCAAWLPACISSSAATSRDAAMISVVSTPVATPISLSMWTMSSVARFPTEAIVFGMAMPPPMPQIAPSINVAPASTRCQHVGHSGAGQIVHMEAEFDVAVLIEAATDQSDTCRGSSMPSQPAR